MARQIEAAGAQPAHHKESARLGEFADLRGLRVLTPQGIVNGQERLSLHLGGIILDQNDQPVAALKHPLFRFPGECPVLFRVGAGAGKELLIEAHDHYRISPCDEVRGEIEAIIGEKIIFRYGGKSAYPSPSQHP